MQNRLLISLLLTLAICGCQVKEMNDLAHEPDQKVFTATIENGFDGVETKTTLDNNGNVLWKLGDQVSIFAGSTINEQYQVTDASDGKTAAALNRVTSPGFVAGTDIDNNVAFYPYAATTGIAKNGSGYVISDITLPSTQYYAEESFDNGAFPMAAVTAYTEDLRLKFKNVLGGLKLLLKGTATIASISIQGNNHEILCGAAEVTVANGSAPAISLTDATAKIVTLNCGNGGVQLNTATATPFIIALPAMTMEGGFTVTVTDTDGATMEIKTTKPQTITRSNLLKMPEVTYEATLYSGHQYVDLGLPSGLKWATCNVGANSPEEYGDYFAWGETEPYYDSLDPLTWKEGKSAGYDWASYQWCKGGYSRMTITKYNTNSIGPVVDNKTTLELIDDAAYANWGGSWRMPTNEEWAELIDNCTLNWTTQNGVNGYLVTGVNGKSIFMPAAGELFVMDLNADGSFGLYWSSSLAYNSNNSCAIDFRSDDILRYAEIRGSGHSVRPVTDEGVRVSVSGITLNQNAITLEAGATTSLSATVTPPNATQPTVIWSSSNNSVAAVDYMGCVTAVSGGIAKITASTYDGGIIALCEVAVYQQYDGEENGHYYIDLGLPSGLKWATCNVGASSPGEYGDYFVWGETEPYYVDGHSQDNPCSAWREGKSGYNWSSYKWCDGSEKSLTKYNTESSCGTVDNKTKLDLADDAARANWGGSWRMPTNEEWIELCANCTSTRMIGGLLITGPNGNSIFLPAAGIRRDDLLLNDGIYGNFWSSSLEAETPDYACRAAFWEYFGVNDRCLRHYGFSVRPVTE